MNKDAWEIFSRPSERSLKAWKETLQKTKAEATVRASCKFRFRKQFRIFSELLFDSSNFWLASWSSSSILGLACWQFSRLPSSSKSEKKLAAKLWYGRHVWQMIKRRVKRQIALVRWPDRCMRVYPQFNSSICHLSTIPDSSRFGKLSYTFSNLPHLLEIGDRKLRFESVSFRAGHTASLWVNQPRKP